MRTIIIGIVVIAALGGFGFYKYMAEKEAELKRIQLKIQQEKIELQRQEKLRREAELEAARKEADKQAGKSALRQELAAEEAKLAELKIKLAEQKSKLSEAEEKVSERKEQNAENKTQLREMLEKITVLKREVSECQKSIDDCKRFALETRYICYDMCIKDSSIKFERMMTEECRSVVPGGIYACLHKYRTGRRYRDDRGIRYKRESRRKHDKDHHHTAKVSFECLQHKVLWTERSAEEYRSKYIGSPRELAETQKKMEKELVLLRKDLDRQQASYDVLLQENKTSIRNRRDGIAEIRQKVNETERLIVRSEGEIRRLNKKLEDF